MSTLRVMFFTIKNCLFFFICIITALLTSSQARFLSHDDHIMSIMHEEWIYEHGRYYDTKEEKDKRFTIFKENVKYIESFNSNRSNTYELGINAFADLTRDEFLSMYAGGLVPTAQKFVTSGFKYENMTHVPPSLDWRLHGAVTPVKTQGGCGSCWAFSAVAAIEGLVNIKSGIITSYSEQNIMDCDNSGDGCKGGRVEAAFQFVTHSGGLSSQTDYPYQMREGACTKHRSSLPVQITGYSTVPPNNEAAMLMAVAKQPVSVGIDPSRIPFYKSGVITGSCGTQVSHAVTAVGYGVNEDGIKFWLMKNSWGESWGEKGYVRLQRDSGTPQGLCGLATQASFPTAK